MSNRKSTCSGLTFQWVYDLSWFKVPQFCSVVPGGCHQLLPLYQPVTAHHRSCREEVGEQHAHKTTLKIGLAFLWCLVWVTTSKTSLHDNALTLVCTQYHDGRFHHRHFHCVCLIFVWYVPVFTRWILFGLLRNKGVSWRRKHCN